MIVSSTVGKKGINYSLNTLKCIAILAVICIHACICNLGPVGFGIDFISRFAVPTFFLISGFYSLYADKNYAMKKYKARSIRLIYLIIISNVLYIVFFSLTQPDYNLWSLFNLDSFMDYILFNIAPGAYHLWFLQALLYCYLFFWAITKLNIRPNRFYVLIPVLLAVNLFLGEFYTLSGNHVHYMYYRNFLFTGLPFFLLGFYIHDRHEMIGEFFSMQASIIFIIASFAVILFELSFITQLVDLSLGSLLLSVALFILCVNNPGANVKVVSWIGGNLYTSMYILHLMVIKWINSVVDLSFLGIFMVFVYFICSALLCYAVHEVKQYVFNQNTASSVNVGSADSRRESAEEMESRIRAEIMEELESGKRK